jgi:hypothetical protein
VIASLASLAVAEAQSASERMSSPEDTRCDDTNVVDDRPATPSDKNMSDEHQKSSHVVQVGGNDALAHLPTSNTESLERLFAQELFPRLGEHVSQDLVSGCDSISRLLRCFATMIEKRWSSTGERNAAVFVRRGQE